MLDALSSAAGAVTGLVNDAETSLALKKCEEEVKRQTGKDIEITTSSIPDSWKEWVRKTAVNSFCCDSTWSFLEKSAYNQRKLELWEKRDITKIVIKVDESPEEDMRSWVVCTVDWPEGGHTVTVTFYPYAGTWSSNNYWWESGYKCWWILSDELVFGLQLYQLPGKCFYKSDWLDGFEDVDPTALLPSGTKKYKRWFQFRHWCIMWYETAQWGWNYQWTETPPPSKDGSPFSLDSVLKLPSMPDISMPKVRLPSLPNVKMPSLPDMPSLSMPSISAPSLSMPSLSAPSLSMPSLSAPSLSMPSMPDRKKRPANRWSAHGIIEMEGLKVKAKGKKVILSNATITHFWEKSGGHIDNEKQERKRLELEAVNDEQAESWVLSLIEGGATEGEQGGCCVLC